MKDKKPKKSITIGKLKLQIKESSKTSENKHKRDDCWLRRRTRNNRTSILSGITANEAKD